MSELLAIINHARSLHQRRKRLAMALDVAMILPAMLAAATAIDLTWSLFAWHLTAAPPDQVTDIGITGRTLTAILLILCPIGYLIWQFRPTARPAPTLYDYAAEYERELNLEHNPLVIATHLASIDTRNHHPITRKLADMSIARGDQLAIWIDPDLPAATIPIRLRTVAGILMLITGLALAVIPTTRNALIRGIAPWASVPPVGRQIITFDWAGTPRLGHDLKITAQCRPRFGPPARQAWLQVNEQQRYPMQPTGTPGQFTFQYRRLDQPVQLAVIAGNSRSATRRLAPVSIPRLQGLQVTVTEAGTTTDRPWPVQGRYLMTIGSTLHLRALADLTDARIDHPQAKGLTLSTTIKPTTRQIKIRLLGPTGLPGNETTTVKILPVLPDDPLLQAKRLVVPDNPQQIARIRKAMTQLDPDESTANNLQADKTRKAAKQATRQGHGKAEQKAENPDNTANANARTSPEPPDNEQSIGTGNLAETIELARQQTEHHANDMADQAPAAYRDLVRRYFLTRGRQEHRP